MNNGSCPVCGEYLSGDGYTKVLHCPNAPLLAVDIAEPDANIIYCEDGEDVNDH